MESTVTADDPALTRRRLLLRDSLAFLGLSLVTLALLFVTLFLFRSFTAHRAVLAERWLDRGKAALAHGHAEQAVGALQVTLDYAPDDRAAKFLLAEALAGAGHTEEANNYFTELWEVEPGSGSLNLQLARLAARRREPQQADNFYRAAIYGTWEGDAVDRRREIRLELARYLLAQNQSDAARAELLVAGGNVSGNAPADMTIAMLLEQAHDPSDARRLYLRAAESPAQRARALLAAGEIAFDDRQFVPAAKFYTQAKDAAGSAIPPLSSQEKLQMTGRLQLLEEVLALTPSRDLPADERVRRILHARDIAHNLLDACQPGTPASSLEIAEVRARWSTRDAVPGHRALLARTDRQDAVIALTDETALATDRLCRREPAALDTQEQALILLAGSNKEPAS